MKPRISLRSPGQHASVAPEAFTSSGNVGADAHDDAVAFDTRYDVWGLGATIKMLFEGNVDYSSSDFTRFEVSASICAALHMHSPQKPYCAR
jgi:hypothetical protein